MYAGHIFRAESGALAERPAEERLEEQESRGTRRVEDLNGRGLASFARRGRSPFKPQTVLLRLQRPPRGAEVKSGDGQTLGTGVVLGEPGCAYEKREGETAFGARRGESLFSRGRELQEGAIPDTNMSRPAR